MIKAAFFDIDGTLMDHSIGQIPSDTKEALAELQRNGVKIFTSTGRHLLELQELGVTELSFDGHVLLNGQIIGTGKGKSKKEAEQSAAKEAISLMGYETN